MPNLRYCIIPVLLAAILTAFLTLSGRSPVFQSATAGSGMRGKHARPRPIDGGYHLRVERSAAAALARNDVVPECPKAIPSAAAGKGLVSPRFSGTGPDVKRGDIGASTSLDTSVQELPEQAVSTGGRFVATPVRAIQLGAMVRLPAALIPHESGMPSPVADAAAGIANDYYRELYDKSIGAVQQQPDPLESPDVVTGAPVAGLPTTGPGDTLVIQNSPEEEQVREHADELYRALFGDEKFNQQGIFSAIEVRLPAAGGSAD